MNPPARFFHSARTLCRSLTVLGLACLLTAPLELRAAGGAFNVFIPVRTSQGQITDQTTTLNFRSPGGAAFVDSTAGIVGGNLNFFDSTVLNAGFGNGIQGGVQTFHDFSRLDITSTRAIVGGQQDFFDSSSLNIGSGNFQAVYGGAQTFHDTSVARLSTSYAFYGGTQTFRDSSHAELYSSGAAQAVTLHLADQASLELYAVQAINGTTNLVFDRATPGTTGGVMQLFFGPLTVGHLTSINDGGLITNRESGGLASALTVDFASSTDVFGGRIEDGVGGGAVSLTKRGTGTLVLSAAQGFTGRTTVEKGAVRLYFGASNAPAQNIIRTSNAGLTLGGGRLEVFGKTGAANRQTFGSLAVTGGASRVVLAPLDAASLDVHFGSYASLTHGSPGTVDFDIPTGSSATMSNVPGTPVLPWATVNGGAAFATLTPQATGSNSAVTPLAPGDAAAAGLLHFYGPGAASNDVGLNPLKAILVSPAVGEQVSSYFYTNNGIAVAPQQELYVHQYNTASTLDLSFNLLYSNGITLQPLTIVKSGRGTLELSGTSRAVYVVTTGPGPGVKLVINEGSVVTDTDLVGNIYLGPQTTLSGYAIVHGGVNVAGGRISPGRSPGVLSAESAEWGGGSSYQWEVNDANGTAGTEAGGWDLFNVSGLLDITAPPENKFTIDVRSLNFANLSGDAAHFDPLQDYSWAIAIAGGGFAINGTPITNLSQFDPDLFAIDRSGFTNADDGLFALTLDPTLHQLLLTYTAPAPVPVPEPGTALFGLAAATGGLARSRRRSLSASSRLS